MLLFFYIIENEKLLGNIGKNYVSGATFVTSSILSVNSCSATKKHIFTYL